MKYYLKLALKLLIIGLCVCVVAAFVLWRYASRSELYETHTFPGTDNPAIDIRFSGFLDASFSAYTKGFLGKKRVLWLASLYSIEGTTNLTPRVGHGRVKAEKNWEPYYDVVWSSDGNRVAFAVDGWYVAACDLKTGEKIDVQSFPVDIKQKDALIEAFINRAQER